MRHALRRKRPSIRWDKGVLRAGSREHDETPNVLATAASLTGRAGAPPGPSATPRTTTGVLGAPKGRPTQATQGVLLPKKRSYVFK